MAEGAAPPRPLTIDEMDWPEFELPPTDLPYGDGGKGNSNRYVVKRHKHYVITLL